MSQAPLSAALHKLQYDVFDCRQYTSGVLQQIGGWRDIPILWDVLVPGGGAVVCTVHIAPAPSIDHIIYDINEGWNFQALKSALQRGTCSIQYIRLQGIDEKDCSLTSPSEKADDEPAEGSVARAIYCGGQKARFRH